MLQGHLCSVKQMFKPLKSDTEISFINFYWPDSVLPATTLSSLLVTICRITNRLREITPILFNRIIRKKFCWNDSAYLTVWLHLIKYPHQPKWHRIQKAVIISSKDLSLVKIVMTNDHLYNKTVIFSLTFINFTKRKRFFWTTAKKVTSLSQALKLYNKRDCGNSIKGNAETHCAVLQQGNKIRGQLWLVDWLWIHTLY